MASLLFVALAPLALVLMLVVGIVAWGRRKAPGGAALVAFSVASAGWLASDAASVLAPSAEMTIWLAQTTFVWAPLPGVAWLAFVLSYTERFTRPARLGVAALAGWSLVYGLVALTNASHRLVWSSWETVSDGPFLGIAYTLGPLAQVQTAFMWTAMVVSFGVLLHAYSGADTGARTLSRWIVTGAIAPMVLNVVFLLGLGLSDKDFTPIAMGISSGAFALGLVRYRFLDLRPVARAALVDNLSEGVLVLDARGQVVDMNPALRTMLGGSDAALGRSLGETSPALAQAIDTRPDATLRLGDGDEARFVDLVVSPLTDGGTQTGRLVLLHDVTRRREERAALHRANADLHHANAELQTRNDELDAFAHTVAHDLKNSIQGVMGWAEILRDDGPGLSRETHGELAGEVVAGAHKMGRIVHELLLLAGVRQATVEPVPVEMGAVVAEALSRVRRPGGASPALPTRWPVAVGYAPWVEEIWVNYLSNAAKYGGPTVTLGASVTASGQARFWVHDDGEGLSPEAQQRLFVPFSRVGASAVDGHGLGLSIVRRIVERLGGTCGVESAPGDGTRFWFALPHAAEARIECEILPPARQSAQAVSSVA